jgi:hypothetical protein
VRWVSPARGEENFTFWISPVTLVSKVLGTSAASRRLHAGGKDAAGRDALHGNWGLYLLILGLVL